MTTALVRVCRRVATVRSPGLLHIVALLACLLPALLPCHSRAESDAWVPATPWIGAKPVARTTREIMKRAQVPVESVAAFTPRHKAQHNRRILVNSDFSPGHLAGGGPDATGPDSASITTSNQAFGVSFTAATFSDTSQNPPSPSGAAGPTQYLLGMNGKLRVFDKLTGAIDSLDVDPAVFFDAVRDQRPVFDLRVRYDRLAQRWFILAANSYGSSNSIGGPNRILLAVSSGAEITGSTVWSFYQFRQDEVAPPGDANCMADSATLGIDAHALYVGANLLCGIGTPGNHGGSVAFVIRKSSVLSGGPIVVSAFRNLSNGPFGTGPFAPQGVDNDNPDPQQGYLLGVDNASFGMLMLRRISDPAGTPMISPNIPLMVAATYPPPLVPHLENSAGANGFLNAMDDRLSDAHIRDGRLWTAHAIGVNAGGRAVTQPTRAGIRWYELGDLTGTPFVVRSGTVYDSAVVSPLYYWLPAVMSSGQGRVGFAFNVAGASSYIDAAAASLFPGGTMLAPSRSTQTTHAYNPQFDFGGSAGRFWGECASASLDPQDDMSIWTAQPYAAGLNTWGVQVTRLLAPAPVVQDALHVCLNESVHAVTLEGSGFYDPGPPYNRLNVQVSGPGVHLADFAYLDSEHIDLTILLEPDAIPSAHDVTVTNPDGQSITVPGGLVVHGGRADFTGDCRVDDQDFLIFVACQTGPGTAYDADDPPAGCTAPIVNSAYLSPDFDGDSDVDATDFAVFQRCLSGPSGWISLEPDCVYGLQ